MKTRKISFLLPALLGAGMVLAGIASAASDPGPGPVSESMFLEIQISGKGYDTRSDDPLAPAPGIVYTEEKHALQVTCYAMCDLSNGLFRLAYYIEPAGSWSAQAVPALETDGSVLIRISGMIPIYVDSDGMAILTTGSLRVQFKTQDDTFTKAKLKSLAMSYWQSKPADPEGNAQLIGAAKMKGKLIDPYDMPAAVMALFGVLL